VQKPGTGEGGESNLSQGVGVAGESNRPNGGESPETGQPAETAPAAETAEAAPASTTPLRDTMREMIRQLQQRGIPLDVILTPKEQRALPILLAEGSYEDAGKQLGTGKSTAIYYVHGILDKARAATDAIGRPSTQAPPPKLSKIRTHIHNVATVLRESGVDPATLMDEDKYRTLFGALDGSTPNADIQAAIGVGGGEYFHGLDAVLRRLVAHPDVPPELYTEVTATKPRDARMPEDLHQAIVAAREQEGKWAHGQPGMILGVLADKGVDLARYVPRGMERMRTVATLLTQHKTPAEIERVTGIPVQTISRLTTQIVDVIRHTATPDELPPDLPPNLFKPYKRQQ
jgi:hypothetical protein